MLELTDKGSDIKLISEQINWTVGTNYLDVEMQVISTKDFHSLFSC